MSLWDTSIRHPAATLCAAVALTLAALPGLLRLELRTDGRALVLRSMPNGRESGGSFQDKRQSFPVLLSFLRTG